MEGNIDPTLVTGAGGLVGYRVAERLQAAGVDVLGVDLRPAGGSFPSVVADAADLPAMRRLMEGRPNVVHAGAVSGPMLMLDDPHGIAQANLGGAMAVFEACRQVGVRRLVWMSSISVYGDQPTRDPVPETARMNPQSFYGHTKAAGELLLNAYAVYYGVSAVALRLSSVYGVRRQTECGLRRVIEAGLAGRPVTVAAEGSSFRQYLHVDDAAEAILQVIAMPEVPQLIYNITGGTYVSEASLAGLLQALVPGLVVEQGAPAWNEGHLGPLSLDAATRDFGFAPSVGLQQGLSDLVEGLKQRESFASFPKRSAS